MEYISHPLIKPNTLQLREYQVSMIKSLSEKNSLVVVSTGLGKTMISILATAVRLERYPNKRAMVLSPTRPLCAQIQKAYQEAFDIEEEKIVLITGMVNPEDREYLYKRSTIIVSTPQCIANDLKHGRIDLNDFCIITFDEAQHSIGNYSYTVVAKKYMEQAQNPLILGLTASPGGTEQKIREICKNLFIEKVEIKTEADKDVVPYVKQVNTEVVKVDLTVDLKNAQEILKVVLKKIFDKLKGYNIYVRTKRDLLEAQKKASAQLSTEKKPILFYLISLIVEGVKVWHVLELLETQSIKAVDLYLEKIELKKTKSDKAILNDQDFLKAVKIIRSARGAPEAAEDNGNNKEGSRGEQERRDYSLLPLQGQHIQPAREPPGGVQACATDRPRRGEGPFAEGADRRHQGLQRRLLQLPHHLAHRRGRACTYHLLIPLYSTTPFPRK